MKYIYVALEITNHLNCLIYMHASRCDLVSGAPILYNKVLTAVPADRIAYLNGEPRPVFRAAAILVGAVVEQRTCELGYQVAVPAMDHDYVHSGPFHARGRLAKLFNGFLDFLFCHLNGGNRLAMIPCRAKDLIFRYVRGGGVGGVPDHFVGDALAAVIDLKGGVAAKLFAHVRV